MREEGTYNGGRFQRESLGEVVFEPRLADLLKLAEVQAMTCMIQMVQMTWDEEMWDRLETLKWGV